jgi:hypothetical protein
VLQGFSTIALEKVVQSVGFFFWNNSAHSDNIRRLHSEFFSGIFLWGEGYGAILDMFRAAKYCIVSSGDGNGVGM